MLIVNWLTATDGVSKPVLRKLPVFTAISHPDRGPGANRKLQNIYFLAQPSHTSHLTYRLGKLGRFGKEGKDQGYYQ